MINPTSSEPEGSGADRADDGDAETERTAGLVDPERLGPWMDGRGLPGTGEPLSVRFVSGGASNEIFEVSRVGTAGRCAARRVRCPRAATRP